MKIKEGGGMDIQNFIAEFKKTFVYDILSQTLSDEQLFEHVVDGDAVLWFKEQTRQMWLMWEKAQAQADQKIKLLLCDEHLKKCESPTGVFNSQYPDEEPCLICLAKQAKAQAVPEGFILVSSEQMSQWGHMANCAQEYGCPECYEARGYAHSLACEINAYFNVNEAQEPTND